MSYDDAGRLARIERPSAGFATDLLYDGRSYLRDAKEVELALILRDGFESGDFACWSAVVGGAAGGVCPASGPSVAPAYSSEGVLHHQVKPAGLERAVLYFAGRPVAILELAASGPAEVLLLSTDHLGTPVLASTLAGGVSWAGGFEPFGADWSGAEAAGVFLRFPGQWGDAAWAVVGSNDGLLQNGYRWFQFAQGSYTRADPLGLLVSLNLFTYARSNPLRYFDPVGLQPKPDSGEWCDELSPLFLLCDCDQELLNAQLAGVRALRSDFCRGEGVSNQSRDVSAVAQNFDVVGGVDGGRAWHDPNLLDNDPCLITCTCRHENFHLQSASDPRLEEMINKGLPQEAIIDYFECLAYDTESNCLEGFASAK